MDEEKHRHPRDVLHKIYVRLGADLSKNRPLIDVVAKLFNASDIRGRLEASAGMKTSNDDQLLQLQRRIFGLRNIDGQIYDSFDKPDTILNGTKTLSGHTWSVSGNGYQTAKIKDGELIADGMNFYASVDYGKPIQYIQATMSFTEVQGKTSGVNDNLVLILQGGKFNLGTMIHLLIGKKNFTLTKRINDGDFIFVPVTKQSNGLSSLKPDDAPYSMSMQLDGNVLTIVDGTGEVYTTTDNDFVTINPTRATFQIGPQPNSQFIGKFQSISVGHRSTDYELIAKNVITKRDMIPLVCHLEDASSRMSSQNKNGIHSPNWLNLSFPPYNAAPNSDITEAFQKAIDSLTRGTVFVPDGDYLLQRTIKLKPKVNIVCGSSTIFKPTATADNFNMFEFPKYQVRDDKTVFTGMRINGLNKNVVGLKVYNSINLYFYDCTIENCKDVGLELNQSQFNQFYNLVLFNNNIGLYINAGTGDQAYTGGNSNTFYSLTLASNVVGSLIHHVSGNYFFSPIPLANRVNSFAFFDCLVNYVIGGCPEATGADAPTVSSVDLKGKTVKKSTFYSSSSILCIENLQNNEATVKPSILLENGSQLDYVNPTGYGQPFISHVSSDHTSSVSLIGKFNAIGNFENITSTPSSLVIRDRNAFTLKDNTKYDKFMLNSAVSPYAPPISGLGKGGVLSSKAIIDDEMGPVTAIKFSNKVTVGTDKAVIHAAHVFPQGIGKKYTGFAVNLKSDVDTTIKVELGEPCSCIIDVKLKAGEWKRVCLMSTCTTSHNVFFCPMDNAGAEVLVSRFCSVNTDNEQIMLKLLDGYFSDRESK